MTSRDNPPGKRWGLAWVAMVAALALHVADEALTGFLPFYNRLVLTNRDTIPWLPFPTFTFPVWLAGLIVLVVALFALTPFVLRGRPFMRSVAYVLGVIMVANAVGHIVASLHGGLWAPGVYSSPLLLATAVYLLFATRRASPRRVSARGA